MSSLEDPVTTPAVTVTARHLVVGIGASAGALGAIRALLDALGPSPRMALLLVQHQAAGEDGLLLDAIASAARMPVRLAEAGVAPAIGTLTVVPAGELASFARGRVRLRPIRSQAERRTPIDRLFRALADDAGSCAVGVVLSGFGSDGALGLEEIAAAGGLALAQDPASAAQREMPDAAIATGFCDHALPPAELARVLADYAEHLHALPDGMEARGRHGDVHRALGRVAELLRAHTGHDFRHYKASTMVRRVERRMQVLRLAAVDAYLDRLEHDPAEGGTLFRELLIGVTAFFRDADAFDALARLVIAPLLAGRAASDDLRVWVPGCASGEEAYSIAMLIAETLDGVERPPKVQIFATDLNERALMVGRRGSYPQGIAANISPERLARFFARRGRRYQVSDSLREMVVFSAHNLVSDPPFSRLDLISCRNLLIYLGPPLQKKLVPVFHYGLKPGGYLFLGSSESLASHGELFRVLDQRHKLGQRKEVRLATPRPALATSAPPSPRGPELGGEADLGAIARRILLDEFAPRYAIVNEEGQALYLGDGVDKYLQPPVGGFSSSIVRMARRGLSGPLRAVLGEAARSRRAQVRQLSGVHTSEGRRDVRLTAQPMPSLGESDALFILVLEDLGATVRTNGAESAGPAGGRGADPDALIEQLERELSRAREELERALQEQDAANEELKSSNEELLSMNEELQSANEELEVSKEEVQGANTALADANADLANLLRSTDIATIFLAANGAIRGFTPEAADIYPLRPTDTGRPLAEFASRLEGLPALPSALGDALRSADATGRHRDGRWFLRRVTAARTSSGGVDGALVSFVDISAQKRTEAELRRTLDLLDSVSNTTPDLIYAKDRQGRMLFANYATLVVIGKTFAEVVGRNEVEWHDNPQEAAAIVAADLEIIGSGETRVLEEVFTTPGGERHVFRSTKAPMRDEAGIVTGLVGVTHDITAEIAARERLTRSEAELRATATLLRGIGDAAVDVIFAKDADSRMIFANAATLAAIGRTEDEVIGRTDREWHHDPAEADALIANDRAVMAAGEPQTIEESFTAPDGLRRMYRAIKSPLRDATGAVTGTVCVTRDITEEDRVAKQLSEAGQRLRIAMDAGEMAAWAIDARTLTVTADAALARVMGLPDGPAELTMDAIRASIHPDDRDEAFADSDRQLRERGRYSLEYRVLGPDGGVRWVETSGRLVIEGGEPSRIIGVSRDITAQREAQDRIALSATRFRAAVDALEGVLWTNDATGQMNGEQPGWGRLTGQSFDDYQGFGWADAVHPDDAQGTVDAWNSAVEARVPFVFATVSGSPAVRGGGSRCARSRSATPRATSSSGWACTPTSKTASARRRRCATARPSGG